MDELHDALIRLSEAQDENHAAVQRFVMDVHDRFEAEGRLIDELRDDLHALANRLEALTRAAS